MIECDELEYSVFVLIILLAISFYFNIKQKRERKKRQKSEMALIKKAYFNPITELPNRKNIDIIINEQISRTSRHKKSFFVIATKVIGYNDIKLKSQEQAEEIIIEIGDRILDSIRDEDTLSHITEDEFLIVFNEYLEDDNIDILFDRINNTLQEKYTINNTVIEVKTKTAQYKYPEDATDSKSLIDKAINQVLNS